MFLFDDTKSGESRLLVDMISDEDHGVDVQLVLVHPPLAVSHHVEEVCVGPELLPSVELCLELPQGLQSNSAVRSALFFPKIRQAGLRVRRF